MSEARRTGPQGRDAPPLALAASGWWWCLSRLGLPPGAGGRHVILLHPATHSGAEVQHRLLIYRIIKEICNAARELARFPAPFSSVLPGLFVAGDDTTKPIRLHQVWQPAPVDVDEDDLPDLGGSAPSVTRLRADNAGADGDESPAATRITLRPHDPGTGEEIEKREVVKGYEYRWHQLFSLFRLLTLIFEAARRVHRLWRLRRRFLQCRRALAHVFEMTLVRHRLDEEVAHRPDQRIDPVW